MPDYTAGGKALMTIAHSYLMDDTNDLFYAADIETTIDVPELLRESGGFTMDFPLPPLGESMFRPFLPLSATHLASDDDDTSLILFDNFSAPESKPEPIPPPKTRSKIPTARHTSTPSQSIVAPRYMTRAASKRQESSALPSRSSAIPTRSTSRTANGTLDRATLSPDYSTDSSTRTGGGSRPGTSTGIRRPSTLVGREPTSHLPIAKERARVDDRPATVAATTKSPSSDLVLVFRGDEADDFLFDV